MVDEARLRVLVEELDEILPRENALVKVAPIGKIRGQGLTGNVNGIMRFGVEVLKAGLVVEERNGKNIESWYSEELDYLRAHPTQSIAAVFRRDDLQKELEPPPAPNTTKMPGTLAITVATVVFFGIFFIGVLTSLKWILVQLSP